jgi:seryl-tRNA synthetase
MLLVGELPDRGRKCYDSCTCYKLLTATSQGFKVPEPLRKYLPGAVDFIPFTKELPKNSTSATWGKEDQGKSKKAKKAPAAATAGASEAADKIKELAV